MKIKLFIFLLLYFAKVPAEANPWMIPLEATSGVIAIAEFAGLIEGVERKVDKLIQAELETAMDLLGQAHRSSREEINLIRDARLRFTKAANLETGLRKGIALYGLAVCHSYFKDYENRNDALIEALNIEPISRTSVEVYRAKRTGISLAGGGDADFEASDLLKLIPSPVFNIFNINDSIIFKSNRDKLFYPGMPQSIIDSDLDSVDKIRIFLLYYDSESYKEERLLHDMQKDIYAFLEKKEIHVNASENSSLKAYYEIKDFL